MRSALHLACYANIPVPWLKALLSHETCDLDLRDDFGSTALHIASEHLNEAAVQLLIQARSPNLPNIMTLRDERGNTPLHEALSLKVNDSFYPINIADNFVPTVKALLENIEDVVVANDHDETPLICAAKLYGQRPRHRRHRRPGAQQYSTKEKCAIVSVIYEIVRHVASRTGRVILVPETTIPPTEDVSDMRPAQRRRIS